MYVNGLQRPRAADRVSRLNQPNNLTMIKYVSRNNTVEDHRITLARANRQVSGPSSRCGTVHRPARDSRQGCPSHSRRSTGPPQLAEPQLLVDSGRPAMGDQSVQIIV